MIALYYKHIALCISNKCILKNAVSCMQTSQAIQVKLTKNNPQRHIQHIHKSAF